MSTEASEERLPKDASAVKASPTSRLRASCDACSNSKVKCDKERPTCRRCINSSTICHYSPSLRIGKVVGSSKRTNTVEGGRCGKATTKLVSTPRSPNQSTGKEVAEQRISNQSCPFQPNAPTFGIQTPASDMENIMGDSWPDVAASFQEASDDWLTEWSQIPNTAYGNGFLPTSPDVLPITTSNLLNSTNAERLGELSPMQSYLNAPPFNATSNGHRQEHEPSDVEAFEKNRTGFGSQIALHTPDNDISRNHDCTDLAKSTLNTLCLRSADGTRAALPAIDTALLNNEIAVEHVFTLLSCTCEHDPYLPFIVAVITSKIIAWYHAVGRVEVSKVSVSSFAATEAVVHIPLTLGTYRPGSDYATRMRIQLVLDELRKVKALVEKFGERFCSKEKSDSSREMGVYSALESFLKARLRETEEDLKR